MLCFWPAFTVEAVAGVQKGKCGVLGAVTRGCAGVNSITMRCHKNEENGHATRNGERGCVDHKILRSMEVLGVKKEQKKAVYDGRWRTIGGVTGDGDGSIGASWRLKNHTIRKHLYRENITDSAQTSGIKRTDDGEHGELQMNYVS